MVAPILGVLLGQLVGRGLGALETSGRRNLADQQRKQSQEQFANAIRRAQGQTLETQDPVFGGPMAGGGEWLGGFDPTSSPENSARFGLNLAQQGYPAGLDVMNRGQQLGADASGNQQDALLKMLGFQTQADLEAARQMAADARAAAANQTRLDVAGMSAEAAAARRQNANTLGAPGQGMERVQEQGSGQWYDRPLAGSQEWVKRMEPIDQAGEALGVLQLQISDLNQSGGNAFGPLSAKMKVRQARILSMLGSLTNSGVLQQGEVERFENAMQDPTSMFGVGATFSTDTLTAPLQELQDMIRTRAENQWRRNFRDQQLPDYLIPPPPPGTVVQ